MKHENLIFTFSDPGRPRMIIKAVSLGTREWSLLLLGETDTCFLFCYQKPWKQISPMTNHIRWMFAKKQTRVKFTFLLSSFIAYSFTVPCCFLRNTVIIAWLKINTNVNVNGMLINCVIIVTFFLYSTLFMKKSSREEFKEVHRKVTNTLFYWKKNQK